MSRTRHVCCLGHFFNDRNAEEHCPCRGRCGFHDKKPVRIMVPKKKGVRK